MLNELELKEKLTAAAYNLYRPLPEDDLQDLITAMLQYIGTTDSVLRDDLIYSNFNQWILKHRLLSFNQLRELACKAISDQHIFYRMGEIEGDGVFTRSFSMLLLPLILISHREHPYLSASEIDQIKESLLRYGREEKDFRGFVKDKGWAHAAAHYADALDDLAQAVELKAPDLRYILSVISPLVCRQDQAYGCGEEERFCAPVLAILRRGLLSDSELVEWIQGFIDKTQNISIYPDKLILRSNIKGFLQSLYFRMKWEFTEHAILSVIEQALREINPYVMKDT